MKVNEKAPLVVEKMISQPVKMKSNFVIKIGSSKRQQTKKFKLLQCYKPISLMPY